MAKQSSDICEGDIYDAVTEALQVRPAWKHLFAFTTTAHLPYLSGAVLSSVVNAALRTALAIILGRVFDIIAALDTGKDSGQEALSQVARYCIVLAGLGVVQWLANSAFLGFWIVFGEEQAANVRRSLFQGLTSMEKTWFDSLPNGTTGLTASIQRKAHEIQIATSQVFGYLAADVVTALASLGLAFYSSWKLTLVLLATLPVSLILLTFASRKMEPAIVKQTEHLNSASKMLSGSLTGIDLVKLCSGYNQEKQTYLKHINNAAAQYRVQARYNAFQIGYTSFWAIGLFVAGFWYGLVLVQQGQRPGQILTTFYAVLATFQGFESMFPNWLVFEKGMAAGQVLEALKIECTTSKDETESVRPGYFVGAIDLRQVNFRYIASSSAQDLADCSLSIPADEITFLVGRSGSGKTTVANLIARTYDTVDESIYIDGIPIQKLNREWVHRHVMILEQTPVIFNDTLYRNIVFGHRDPSSVSQHQMSEVCQLFDLEPTISTLTGGIHAMIGGKSCPLSGGQRQRIALARAYLRDPAILILDEPTSALDQNSRDYLMDKIREWRYGRTTVVISHDLERIKNDEFVYVLERGAVTKSGFKRDLTNSDLGVFLSTALAQSPITNMPNIAINIISPIREDGSWHFNRRLLKQPSPQAQSWLRSRSNSSIYSNVSYASRRPSVLSGRLRPAELNPMPISPLYGNSGASSPRLAGHHLFPEQASQMSSFLNRRFETSTLRSFADFNRKQTPPRSPYVTIDLASLETGRDTQQSKTKRSCAVDFGLLPKKSKKRGDLSLLSVLRTVFPALNKLATCYLIIGVLMTATAALTTPAFSFCLAKLLAAMWSSGDRVAEGRQWALYILVIAVVDGACSGLGRYLLESSAQSWVDATRRRALSTILRQPKSWFMENKESETIIVDALDIHCEEMRNLVGRFMPILISVAVMVSVSVVWAIIICWKLTLVAIAPLPIVLIVLRGYTYFGDKWERRCADGAEETGAVLTEVLSFLRTIRSYDLTGHFNSKYMQAVERCLRLGTKKALYTCSLFGLYQAFSYFLTALLFYYGTLLLTQGNTTSVAEVLQVMNLLLFGIATATDLLSAMPQIVMAMASASRVLAYTRLVGGEIDLDDSLQRGRASPLPICMNDLSFAYPNIGGEKSSLKHLTLDIQPGKCTVIVGSSGSGKSTILSLLLGLYRPSPPASLTYADLPSSMMNPQQLRATIGYVPQTPFLFPATLADNIAYGLDADSALRHLTNIRAAARDAGIDEYISSLPNGYDTLVGEGGVALSGGQAQRVSIARALVRRPSLLVMDEPTSALDAESAAHVKECVAELVAQWRAERKQAAVVMVTHNVEIMRVADVIVVVEDGRNVEQGAFEDLWFNGDAFRRLVRQNEEDV